MKKIEIPEGYEARIEGNKIILEPKESEDEKIRKKILADYKERLTIESFAYKNPECNKEIVDYLEKAIAYLEKQKEPKPVEWEWPNLSNCIKNCKKCLAKCFYRKEAYEEKKPADWSEDEKIRKQLIDEVKEQINNIPAPDCCNSDDLKRLTILESWLAYLEKQKEQDKCPEYCVRSHCIGCSIYKKQKEQSITANDLDEEVHRFFDDCIVVHEAKLYGNISERVIPVDCYELTARHFAKWGEQQKEQKPAEWSEEEQQTISFAVDWLTKMLERTNVPEAKRDIESVILGLKSLRPQSHWKPSEEQMEYLAAAIEESNENPILESLYNELKKLK